MCYFFVQMFWKDTTGPSLLMGRHLQAKHTQWRYYEVSAVAFFFLLLVKHIKNSQEKPEILCCLTFIIMS